MICGIYMKERFFVGELMMKITFRQIIYVFVGATLSSCGCKEEKVELDFAFGQTSASVDDFMQRNGLSSIEEIDCADLCIDFDPRIAVRDCELTWEQEYLDGLESETEPQRESPVDTGPEEPLVNSVICEGTSYRSCD